MKKYIALSALLVMVLTGCSKDKHHDEAKEEKTSTETAEKNESEEKKEDDKKEDDKKEEKNEGNNAKVEETGLEYTDSQAAAMGQAEDSASLDWDSTNSTTQSEGDSSWDSTNSTTQSEGDSSWDLADSTTQAAPTLQKSSYGRMGRNSFGRGAMNSADMDRNTMDAAGYRASLRDYTDNDVVRNVLNAEMADSTIY
jgi:hypothetical protein